MDLALILSVLALLTAPFLAQRISKVPAVKAGLDGFVMLTVLGLITLTLVPEALSHGGIWGLLVALLGFGLPWIAEFVFHRAEEMTHRIVLIVAALALVIHASSDGAVLAYAGSSGQGIYVAAGIVLHRIGVAIALWWLLRPILTPLNGYFILIALGIMTIFGYALATYATEWYGLPVIGYWQAFASGSLMHVVLHPLEDHSHAPKEGTLTAHRVGTVLGMLFVIVMIVAHYIHHDLTPDSTSHTVHHAIDRLGQMGMLLAPLLLLIIAIVGTLKHIYAVRDHQPLSLTYFYAGAKKAAPWTLALWLAATIFMELASIYPAPGMGSALLFAVWLSGVCAILIHMGARAFFATLLPRMTAHSHTHKHSH